MKNRLHKLKRDNPELADKPEIEEVAEDIDRYAAIEALAATEGGKLLMAGLMADITSTVDAVASGFRTLPEVELRALCSRLDDRLTFARSLTRAEGQKELAEGFLAELLK